MAKKSSRDRNKLKELILYVAAKSERDPRFGATKLNKILFYSDFAAYARLGESITGETYQRLDHGPAPRGLLPAQRELEQEASCAIAERDHFGRRQKRLVALRDPDLGSFSGGEIALVDQVIDELWDHSATEVSELSHLSLGWQLAAPGEDIPYETVFVASPRPLSPREIEHGRALRQAG